MLIRSTLIGAAAIAGSLLFATTSAFATNPEKPVIAGKTPDAAATPAATADKQRYCIIEAQTGSRIPVRACMTRREWLSRGFDPLHP